MKTTKQQTADTVLSKGTVNTIGLSPASAMEKTRPISHMCIGDRNLAIRVSDSLHADFNRTCKERGLSVTRALKILMSDWIAA